MQFHVEFKYDPHEREKLLHFLAADALKPDNPIKFLGAWVSIGTGTGYAIIETKDPAALYYNCTSWSEYGTLQVTPILSVEEIN